MSVVKTSGADGRITDVSGADWDSLWAHIFKN